MPSFEGTGVGLALRSEEKLYQNSLEEGFVGRSLKINKGATFLFQSASILIKFQGHLNKHSYPVNAAFVQHPRGLRFHHHKQII